MSIEIIVGRNGTDKIKKMCENIVEKYSVNKKIYVIVPTGMEYKYQKNIMEYMKKEVLLNIEVLTFNKIYNKLFLNADDKIMTKSMEKMLIYDILSNNKNDLKILNNAEKYLSLVEEYINEFEEANIDNFDNIITKIESVSLKDKINDLNLVYKIYEEKTKNKYINKNSKLKLIANKVDEIGFFTNTEIYFAGFDNLLINERNIVEKAIEQANNITFEVINSAQETEEFNVFLESEKLINDIKKIAKKISKEIKINKRIEVVKYKNSELKYIENNVDKLNVSTKYEENVENVKMFLAKNPYTEIEYVAKNILKLVSENKYMYKDIAIMNRNGETYNNIIKSTFAKFNISINLQEENNLKNNLVVKNVIETLEVVKKEWDKSQELSHSNITKKIYEKLVEQNVEAKINNNLKIINENKINKVDEYKNIMNLIYQVFEEILELFGENVTDFQIYKNKLELALENITYNNYQEIYDAVLIGDINKIIKRDTKVIFTIGINDGILPTSVKEEGFINDANRKDLIGLGIEIAEGTMQELYKEQYEVYKVFSTATERIYITYSSTDKEGKALRPSLIIDKIKGFFPQLKTESDVITKETNISTLEQTFEEMIGNLREYQDEKDIDSIWFDVYKKFESDERLKKAMLALDYTNQPEKLSEENLEKVYGEIFRTSISKLQAYKSCPFAYYINYGLKVKKQDNALNSMETGSFLHEVIDEFFSKYVDLHFSQVEDFNIEETVKTIVAKKLGEEKNIKFTANAKYRNITRRLEKVLLESIKYIIYQLKNSDFKIYGNEIEFKEGAKYEPIKLTLEDGKEIEIIGKIDRVDITTYEDRKYVRIVDYKSSTKKIDLNNVLNGIELQLITYLDSITRYEGFVPAGMVYFNMIEPMVNAKKNLEDEEIEKEVKKLFRMKGVLLEDVNIIRKMDNRMQSGSSDIVTAEISKTAEKLSARGGTYLDEEQFKILQEKVLEIIKELVAEILTGNIEIRPLLNNKKSVCQYCDYASICRFDITRKDNEYCKVKKIEKRNEE